MATLGLVAKIVKPSGFATLKTLLVARMWAAPGMCWRNHGGLAGDVFAHMLCRDLRSDGKAAAFRPDKDVTVFPS
jgi:hypothetical protein